jgi:WD40 repeat protein
VQIWSLAKGRHLWTYRGHEWGITSLAWSPDGNLIASGSDDMTVQIWNPFQRTRLFTYRGHAGGLTNFVEAVAWSPDGTMIASGSDDGQVHVWQMTRQRGTVTRM